MLDRQFLRAFFDQIEQASDEQLQDKVEKVERLRRTLARGSEARLDADFLLKHLRREMLERQLGSSSQR